MMKVITVLILFLMIPIGSAIGEEKVFKKKCISCHSLTKTKIGPPLGDIWNKKGGSHKGYRYSKAMKTSKVIWNEETLDLFLTNPKKFIKGTKMSIRGLKPKYRTPIIEYLKRQN